MAEGLAVEEVLVEVDVVEVLVEVDVVEVLLLLLLDTAAAPYL